MLHERIEWGVAASGFDGRRPALRRTLHSDGDDFPQLLEELRFFFRAPVENQRVQAVPGAGLNVPIWLLGSSGFSARLAGQLGLPFAFAGHFSPEYILPALKLYRETFDASAELEKPYAMLAMNLIAADTDAEAQFLATTQFQSFLRLTRGMPGEMQLRSKSLRPLTLREAPSKSVCLFYHRERGNGYNPSGTVCRTARDELMFNAMIFDHKARRELRDRC